MAKIIVFAAVVLMLLAACVVSAQQSTPLKNGVYTTVHLIANTAEYFDINLRNNHKGVTTFITTYGCDAIVTLYASTKPQPSAVNHQWYLNVNISSSAFLDVEQRQLNDADQLYYSLVTAVTSPCSAFFVSHVKHSLNLIQLEDSIPQFGAFQPNSQVPALYHFLEYDLGESDSRLDSLMVMVTNHHTRKSGDDSTYNVFVSNSNSRPIEGKAQWSGISTSNGDSALVINKQDPKFVNGGKYWIGIEFKPNGPFSKNEDSHYSVVVHPNFASQRSGFDKPLILLQQQPQFAFVQQGNFIYFSLYVDKSVAGRVLNVDAKTEYGEILMYASSKTTRPDKNNYEFRGGKRVEFRYQQATFVYVAVEALPHASGFAAFEAVFNRL